MKLQMTPIVGALLHKTATLAFLLHEHQQLGSLLTQNTNPLIGLFNNLGPFRDDMDMLYVIISIILLEEVHMGSYIPC